MRQATLALAALLALAAAGCGPAPDVVQGTVVSYDAEAKILVLEDELEPGHTMEMSLAQAEIGADPVPGDLVRIAYHAADDRGHATRVMNVTRQEELSDKGGGH